jgi:N-acetylglucosamine-6-sulfatase
MTQRRRRTLRTVCAVLFAAVVAVGGLAIGSGAKPRAAATAAAAPAKPNIVFILTDDLSWNLINSRFAPHIVQLEKRGETFNHYFVADSLCCPSRSTIFTGLFPHDTKVVANVGPNGGFQKFQSERLYKRTFAVAIKPHGYLTATLGKYLNGYGRPTMTKTTAPIPPTYPDLLLPRGRAPGPCCYGTRFARGTRPSPMKRLAPWIGQLRSGEPGMGLARFGLGC